MSSSLHRSPHLFTKLSSTRNTVAENNWRPHCRYHNLVFHFSLFFIQRLSLLFIFLSQNMASMAVATSTSKIFLFRHNNKEVTSRTLGNHAHTSGSTTRVRIHCKQPDQSMCLPSKHKPWWRISDARKNGRSFAPASALSPELEDMRVSTTSYEGMSVAATTTGSQQTKIRIDVSGAKTQAIFDDVFSKMVEAAQPIPGFRQVKGGKTPNVPKDALMQILGPYNVYKQVIKKVIDSTVADYVKKENLKVTKDLKVEQSFEELEETFEEGQEFSFDAVIQLKETAASNS